MNPQKKKETLRFIKFLLFSASAGLIEFGSFSLLSACTPWPYWPCYLIALTLSVLWNFTFNRRFTFQSAANVPVAMLKDQRESLFGPPMRAGGLYQQIIDPLDTLAYLQLG